MKRFPFLSVVIAAVLMVAAVGCTTMKEFPEDDYADQSRVAPARILVDDPYYGTIVLERDPFTGRYYQVNDRFGSYGYSSRYNTYDRYYRDGYSRNQNVYYGNRYRQVPAPTTQQNTRTQEETKEYDRQKQEARRRILGKNN